MPSWRAGAAPRGGWAVACCAAVVLACAAPASAQIAAPAAPGPYVIDVHAATVGIPQATTFYPPLPANTIVPARGFGFDLGGHVYAGRLGAARLGFGASVAQIRGTASTARTSVVATDSTGATTNAGATVVIYPDITSTVRLIAPQLSFNFGTADGWSYLSAGLTLARVTVDASAVPGSAALSHDSGTMTGFNAGAGARWFVTRHLGVGFDLRFHRAGSARIFAAAAGMAVK